MPQNTSQFTATNSFIYGLLVDGLVFYVGQTSRGKLEPEGYLKNGRFGSWARKLCRLLAEYHRSGLRLDWCVLENVPIEDLDDSERFWISSLRAAGVDLANRTDGGGKNTRGMKKTSEQRERNRQKALEQFKDPTQRAKAGIANIGRRPWNKGNSLRVPNAPSEKTLDARDSDSWFQRKRRGPGRGGRREYSQERLLEIKKKLSESAKRDWARRKANAC